MSHGTTKAELLGAIRDLAEDGSPPSISDMNERGEFSHTTYYNYFDSWNDALRQAGFEPNHETGVSFKKKCEICGESFEVTPFGSDRRFCSRECFAEHREGMFRGESHPRYSERIEVECDCCGATLIRLPYRVSKNEHHFCDRSCRGDWLSGEMEGGSNPRWKDKVSLKCSQCAEEFKRHQFTLHGQDRVFCSRECHMQWCRESGTGKNNPNWKGGAIQYQRYGPRWKSIRREVIASQNGKCRACGTDRERLSRDLHVHHITPVRDFLDAESGEIDHDSANRRENLVALCKSCHEQWEGSPVVPIALDA